MAKLTINIPDQHVQRVLDAFTYSIMPYGEDGERVPATAQDVRNYIINDVKQLVRTAERAKARREAEQVVEDVEIT